MTSGPDPDLAAQVLRAAEDAFAKVMAGVPEQPETMPTGMDLADAIRWSGDRVTELLANLAELPLESLVEFDDQTGSTVAADGLPAADGPPPTGAPLNVRADVGGIAEVRVWVHPVGKLDKGELHFLLSDLLAADGESIPGALADFTPAYLSTPIIAGATSLLRLRIPAGAAVGSYHGHVLAHGATGAAVPITVTLS